MEREQKLWAASGVLALVFLAYGANKLLNAEASHQSFEDWGYPGWVHWPVGVVQVASAGLLLWPPARPYACGVLVVVMLTAFVTHLLNDEWLFAPGPVAVGAAVGALGWVDRPAWFRERVA